MKLLLLLNSYVRKNIQNFIFIFIDDCCCVVIGSCYSFPSPVLSFSSTDPTELIIKKHLSLKFDFFSSTFYNERKIERKRMQSIVTGYFIRFFFYISNRCFKSS